MDHDPDTRPGCLGPLLIAIAAGLAGGATAMLTGQGLAVAVSLYAACALAGFLLALAMLALAAPASHPEACHE
ncbi:hypothetical protein LAZ29_10255 [Cereibacter sphaeroides]|uniref:hypothetical protein n=1 Tax=Cereibacter sphaeroides TaxID=1063 RepID=UPI001F1CDAB4|nr:hypothetical protein [Cereibacter sphaeroides]MCE6951312.1 hypothetical protein [Cereibacter sphaeroides]